jgi:hypothetical protein
MQVRCQACGHVQEVSDQAFGDQDRVTIACPACGRALQVVSPRLQTLRMETTRRSVPVVAEDTSLEGKRLFLPPDQRLSLKVLEGEEKGTVYLLAKPRTLIGRVNTDILIEDRLASRLHCAIEVGEEGIVLRDLGSTNGTLVNDEPVVTALLVNGSTFRVGNQLFQLIVTAK